MDKKAFLLDKADDDDNNNSIIKLDVNKYSTTEDAIEDDGIDPDWYNALSFGFSDDITRQDVLNLFADSGWNLFGKFVDEVADAIADEVVEEYKEAGDGNLQKAIAYVILDKWNKLA